MGGFYSRRQRKLVNAFAERDGLDCIEVTPKGREWLATENGWLESLLAHAKASGSRMCERWDGYPGRRHFKDSE